MSNDDYKLSKRKYVLGVAAVLVVVIYIVRLFVLQLTSDDYKLRADSNAFMRRIQFPARGAITDRHGKLLVYNQPAYDIMVIMQEQVGVDTLDLCESLGIDTAWYSRRMAEIKDHRRNPGYSRFTQQLFMSQLSAAEFSNFQEKIFRFPGFYIQKRSIRQYAYPYAAHILGDIGEVNPADIEADDYYRMGDYIGKQGVEASYEHQLRGIKGSEILLRDVHGRIKGRYQDGRFDEQPIPGKNITLSLDIDLQALGERLMRGKLGSIVAIEPSTGEILCMVTSPTYDPRTMVGRQRGKKHHELSLDPMKPLLNRAIMGTYPPGSTFKTSQALTFLEEGIITPQTRYPCSRGFHYGRLTVGCHPHGSPLDLIPAIATSCNGYFCWGLLNMFNNRGKYPTTQEAMTTWKNYMVSMGFGYALGVDLPGEKRGMIPNAQYYDKAYKESWNGLTVISISIGQGEVTLTPLQIANLGATIANRGWFITPHIVHEIQDEEIDTLYRTRRYTKVSAPHYETVVKGMEGAVRGGTCHAAFTTQYITCGKTGTAQNRGHDHSVFMGFAPRDNPQIAIAVYVENGGWGATFGVPIGALMMEQFINGHLSEASEAKAEGIANKTINYGDYVR
ncbi:MAG: penicillin-binding protein 2 [Bacteroidaceae bacterium]|nr:penicillin-binding protein 2 [Bacteroidaceae bacterium]MBR1801063.1 penicillin-binding protein 2 [Bacteroidaceae bacterium]